MLGGSGNGEAIAANRHNDANVIAIGERMASVQIIARIRKVDTFG